MLMRNVLDLDPKKMDPKDMTVLFDLKGSQHGRKTLDDPRDVLNLNTEYEKTIKG